jgi:hypothetical protein
MTPIAIIPESSNASTLAAAITALSVSPQWDTAKHEWLLDQVYRQDEPDTCLCGHYPIVEICVLRNRHNGNLAIVGNVCVKKFLGLPSDQIFQALKRVAKDPDKPLNEAAISHALAKHWINKWEHDFCLNTMRKRSLSDKQMAKRRQINLNLIARTSRTRSQPST